MVWNCLHFGNSSCQPISDPLLILSEPGDIQVDLQLGSLSTARSSATFRIFFKEIVNLKTSILTILESTFELCHKAE